MDMDHFAKVDAYIEELLIPPDTALDAALEAANRAGLPDIHVSPVQGKYIQFLARLIGAKRILEIGTLAGYSTIWLARALDDAGTLVSLEFDPKHAEIAKENITRAGLADRVTIKVGPALESLPNLEQQGLDPFDLVFIDADKGNNKHYMDWAIKLSRPGALILADNVIRYGNVMTPKAGDDAANAIHDFNKLIAGDPRLDVAIQQQVGSKGHDGIALARVKG